MGIPGNNWQEKCCCIAKCIGLFVVHKVSLEIPCRVLFSPGHITPINLLFACSLLPAMNVKQYLIIDDCPSEVDHLTNLLTSFTFYNLAAVVTSIDAAIEVLTTQPIDLIFLDLRLPGQSGMTLLRAGIKLPPVIIVSAYSEYAVEAFDIGLAADYLLKPFPAERLHKALARALQAKGDSDPPITLNAVFLKMGRKIQRFDYNTIDYVEAYGIYTKVYDGDQMRVVNERLSSLEKLLPGRNFIRVHKSYLININKITSYDRQNFWLDNTKIPIGISYRPRLQALLSLFDTPESNAVPTTA